jgi:SSS family solute:Na+ symporter
MPELSAADVAVLAIYLAGIAGIGFWAGRRSRTSEDFMAAGRSVPGWAVGLSILGTYVSSISFIALPGKAYATDWNAFVFSLAIPPTAWVAVRFFVPFYRAAGSLSSYEHLETRFGPWARTYAVICYLLLQLARMGTIMYLLALALAPITGWSIPTLIVVTGVLVLAYTLYGGIEAVIWTDVVQSLVFVGGSLACLAALLYALPGGVGTYMQVGAAHDKFSLGSYGAGVGQSTFWVVLLYGLFINLQNFGIDQSYVQRYQAAASPAAARRAVWIGALLYVPTSLVFFLIGTGLFVFYTTFPERLPEAIAGSPDTVFPYFMVHELPAGLAGLLVASVFAAAQSTISTSINSSATLVLCDLCDRYVRRVSVERERLLVLRVASLAVGLGGIAMALAMMRIKTALDAWWQLAGIASGGMLGLFLLGLLSRRATNRHGAVATAAGVLVIVWMTVSPAWASRWSSPLHPNLVIVIGTTTILVVGLALSLIRQVQSGDNDCA